MLFRSRLLFARAPLISLLLLGANTHFLPTIGAWFGPLLGRVSYNKLAVDAAKAKVEVLSAYLEKTLADKTFLVGDRISIADIFVASALTRGFEFVRRLPPLPSL